MYTKEEKKKPYKETTYLQQAIREDYYINTRYRNSDIYSSTLYSL